MMLMTDEKIPKKMLYSQMEEKLPKGRPRTRWVDQIRKDILVYKSEGIGANRKKYKKTRSGRMDMAGDLYVIVDLYLWKRLKNVDVYSLGTSSISCHCV